MIDLHECPGGCGRNLTQDELACRTCFELLPQPLRQAYRTAQIFTSDHDGKAQAEALALGWFAEREATPRGTRKTDSNGTTYEWSGNAWRMVPRSELDAEAWRKSRGQA